jgi:hypothetical protein
MLIVSRQSFACFLVLAGAGCSAGDRPVRQRGLVTLEGQPLAGVTVTFMSENNKRPAWGVTDDEGRFELTTYDPKDGCLPGEYKIIVTAPAPPLPGDLPPGLVAPEVLNAARRAFPPIHPNYQSAEKTPLRRVVPAPAGDIVLGLNNNGS